MVRRGRGTYTTMQIELSLQFGARIDFDVVSVLASGWWSLLALIIICSHHFGNLDVVVTMREVCVLVDAIGHIGQGK